MIKNTSDGVVGTYVRPLKPSEIMINNYDITQAYVCKETRYFNSTKYDLTVVDRTGVITHIPRFNGNTNGTFTLRVTWSVRKAFVDDFLKNMEGYQYLNNEELNYLMQSVINQRSTYGDINAVLDYEIKETEFTEHRQSIYVTNQDVVITTISPDKTPAHPFSQTTVKHNNKIKGDFDDTDNATIKLVYVDNSGKRGARYVNLCGQIQKLTPKVDINSTDGIYIYTRQKKMDSPSEHYMVKTMVSIDDAEKVLGIYKTYEEAQYGGDPKNGVKLRILESENSLTLAKNELANKSLEVEKLIADSKIQEQQYKMLLADYQRTTELLKTSEENKKILQAQILLDKKHAVDLQKQEYEVKNAWRKDVSDIIKFTVPVILAVAGAVTAIVKIKEQK